MQPDSLLSQLREKDFSFQRFRPIAAKYCVFQLGKFLDLLTT